MRELLDPDVRYYTYEDNVAKPRYLIHDPVTGLDMDIMTYAVYKLADGNRTSLSDPSIFASLVDKVFQTLFQHFISENASLDAPSWGYEPVGAQTEALGDRMIYDSSAGKMQKGASMQFFQSNPGSIVWIQGAKEVEELRMSPVAVWLTILVLSFLIVFIVTTAIVSRKYLKPLERNVECLADIIVLLARSEWFMKKVEEKGVDGLKEDDILRTRLGWFKTGNGETRWGIELVVHGVEWVDKLKAAEPKT